MEFRLVVQAYYDPVGMIFCFGPILASLFFTIAYSGFAEEFGWRGYLFHKLKDLSWLEISLFTAKGGGTI